MTSGGSPFSEYAQVEKPAIDLFAELGWETKDCFSEFDGGESTLGRETKGEVVLIERLRSALQHLNPSLPAHALAQAVEELTRGRAAMSPVRANREVYDLIKDGVRVTVEDSDGNGEATEIVRVIDLDNPSNNDFFLASQFWVTGDMYTRRPDLIGFVNGLPLVFIELKAMHKELKAAYDNNLKDYKDTIPHLFWYNALIILSNGSEARIGSVTSNWEHFADWKKINSEGEEGVVSLDTLIRGTCTPARLLDLVENFTLFQDVRGGQVKIVAKNHQYLGVNSSIEALKDIRNRDGKLGVFWHTQGSGKSISMIFFAQKVHRKLPGNWTFVVVTDRIELDDQIYKNFAGGGAITETQAQAESGADLRRLLSEDHRYVFTLIQKFHVGKGQTHPVLSERTNIIVMADEAHRSQYDTLSLNMRNALPNASYIAFTGTPLIIGEEETKDLFGDYVSIYNFTQSVEDGATVPLYYENRIPELQLTNEDLTDDMRKLLEDAELDEEQEKKVEREFSRQYHLITRDDRLETVAQDIVSHFMGRGFPGKAMIVSIDKATAVRMYDKVQVHWKQHLDRLREQYARSENKTESHQLKRDIEFMEQTDMAVVVSQAQNEIANMREKGVDIAPHRRRIVSEDLDSKFKDPKDRFRIVFVCAMWMTGFDVPSCSTIYLDKPMRNHTLMQTIARANRVFPDKTNGLIVDYIGVFRSLERALAIYGTGIGGGARKDERPVRDKSELVEALRAALDKVEAFCLELGANLSDILQTEGFFSIKLIDDAVDAIKVNDQSKQNFVALASDVMRLYKAILPDEAANEFRKERDLVAVIAAKVKPPGEQPDISEVMSEIEDLLDQSIAAEGYVIDSPLEDEEGRYIDLSRIDFEALAKHFANARKRIETDRLREIIERALNTLVEVNPTRLNYTEKFQEMIAEYNAGSINVETLFGMLVEFAQELNEEEKRGISENLNEEELTIFDLLTKPEIELTDSERNQVKNAARDLLNTLKAEKLVLDWRNRQQTRAGVRVTIERVLETGLPGAYSDEQYHSKCAQLYQHVYESYPNAEHSAYVDRR